MPAPPPSTVPAKQFYGFRGPLRRRRSSFCVRIGKQNSSASSAASFPGWQDEQGWIRLAEVQAPQDRTILDQHAVAVQWTGSSMLNVVSSHRPSRRLWQKKLNVVSSFSRRDDFKLAKFLVALEELGIWQALCFFKELEILQSFCVPWCINE